MTDTPPPEGGCAFGEIFGGIFEALGDIALHFDSSGRLTHLNDSAGEFLAGRAKIGDSYKAIPIKDVAYFYADQKFTYARIGERNYPTTVLLKTLEDEFPEQFVRIHKTYLVNFNYIESIVLKENSVIITGESLPIGLAYRKQFMSRLQLLK